MGSEIEGKANGSEHKETDGDNRGCNARHATLLMLEKHEDKDTGTPEEQAEQVKATGTATVGKDEQLEVQRGRSKIHSMKTMKQWENWKMRRSDIPQITFPSFH